MNVITKTNHKPVTGVVCVVVEEITSLD